MKDAKEIMIDALNNTVTNKMIADIIVDLLDDQMIYEALADALGSRVESWLSEAVEDFLDAYE